MRAEAIKLLGAVSARGHADAKRAVLGLLKDLVPNVRRDACLALRELADLGDRPSKGLGTQLTYTSADVIKLKRDAECIDALGGLLEDKIGFVRKAAAEVRHDV